MVQPDVIGAPTYQTYTDSTMAIQDKFDIIATSIKQDLDGVDADAREKASLERERYTRNAEAFRAAAESEADDKNVKDFEVRLYGDQNTAKRDILYVSYTVTDRTSGKYERVEEYLRKLLAATRLSDYFSADARSNVHREEIKEEGEKVEIMFLRHNHTHIDLKKDPVDPIARDAPDEDNGGGGRF